MWYNYNMEKEQQDSRRAERFEDAFESLKRQQDEVTLVQKGVQAYRKAERKISGYDLSAADFLFDSEKNEDGDWNKEQTAEANHSDPLGEKLKEYILKSYIENGREYYDNQHSKVEAELTLKLLGPDRTDDTDKEKDIIDTAENEIAQIANGSPEGYYVVNGLDFRNHIRELKNDELVTTPYVEDHLERLMSNMEEGRPTFIHGHLGSGKTELAIMAAKHSQISKAALDEALASVDEYKKSLPSEMLKNDTAKALRSELARVYENNVDKYTIALRDGDTEAVNKFSALLISGSKDLTTQDLYVDKTLKLTKFNGKSIQEHLSDVNEEVEKWKADHPEEAKDPATLAHESDKILELFKLKNQAFGTEVQDIENALYAGIKQGRPVIIDEVNAIPSSILISLNDILTKRPGQTCYVPGKGPTKIANGFSITMTGNISSGVMEYLGTNDLNPAFLSRPDIFEHGYLPMSVESGKYNEQDQPRKNELFYVAIAKLADQNGNLVLPEMDKSLNNILHLTQLAHLTQKIFAGEMMETKLNTMSGDEHVPRLNKSVMSMRGVLNVLEKWQSTKYDESNFDLALWETFIDTITDADDKNLVIALAKSQGFFQERDGWIINTRERGSAPISLEEAHPGDFDKTRRPREVMNYRDVLEMLYGPAPERDYDKIDLDDIEDLANDEATIEDYNEIEASIKELNQVIDSLKRLGEQCGCSINTEAN